ncbi:hypothetical protein Kpol_499p13 [Vanderwaltozyma polyspora DSM 70294]|uniref:DNA/RNA-binding protein Alba-like domain-containing protein n=1 Tax=Vanderwaltozyma polyspora (strain ATCC 22028 / DSM 70294 / BCRC 21397 / CBS 2163 / NBRC 10782 / NRRL Y-8283 / UCD 57-17) TaxID=436907 RepID=A7TP16_VANPO|nr:uncharacterized protein Kpol_499p13 [Vanderwaltozyma polyspora DSM 70294]EDO15985.1 hypothetical protein Kpol_499p13 [Vanderwaltozyma polyspora DSM 70294]
MSKLYYNNQFITDLIPNYNNNECLNLIENLILDQVLLNEKKKIEKSIKITKNDNIKKSIDRLLKLFSNDTDGGKRTICLYSLGNNLQKLLTILQIFKKIQKNTVKIIQYNKLTSFNQVTNKKGNELLESKKFIPILIVILTTEKITDNNSLNLESLGFTRQLD